MGDPDDDEPHPSYNPLSYHLGSVWAVENATIAFGLRRFGFNACMVDLTEALFDLAERYPGYRVPECIGGYPRDESRSPGAMAAIWRRRSATSADAADARRMR